MANATGLDPGIWGFESLTGYDCGIGSRDFGSKAASFKLRRPACGRQVLKVRSLPSVLYAHGGTGIHRRLKICVFWVRIPVGILMACSSTVRVTLL